MTLSTLLNSNASCNWSPKNPTAESVGSDEVSGDTIYLKLRQPIIGENTSIWNVKNSNLL